MRHKSPVESDVATDYLVGFPERVTRAHRSTACVAMRVGGLVVLLGIRFYWLPACPLNSDEPQHAHVAWSIAQGAMPYRGVLDNHGPLFSAMYWALLCMLGERPDILWWLRLAVVPWYLLALVATWIIARWLHSRGVADATAVLVGAVCFDVKDSVEARLGRRWTSNGQRSAGPLRYPLSHDRAWPYRHRIKKPSHRSGVVRFAPG